jgi:MbtH protein
MKEGKMSWDSPDTRFLVVVNHEEQYSIWPDYKALPHGWRAVDKQGNKDECLAYIESVWTDMRPLSLRQALQAQGQG